MTEKELLYVEDALGHEQYFNLQCAQTAQQIQDKELKSFAESMQKRWLGSSICGDVRLLLYTAMHRVSFPKRETLL